jgi:hypothetical protein
VPVCLKAWTATATEINGGDACNPNPCTEEHRSVCVADGDSYSCDCDEGYIENGDGVCIKDDNPLDPCDPNPCTERYRGECEAEDEDTYACNCSVGFEEEDGLCLPVCDPAQASVAICDLAHESAPFMVSANGHGAVIWNKADRKWMFFEHVYRNWDDGHWTHDVLYDTYFGVRTPSAVCGSIQSRRHMWVICTKRT